MGVLIFSGLGFVFAEKKYKNPSFHTVIFVTVVSADKNSSVADKEVSSQGLSETIIGWTHSPFFIQNLGFGVSGKKQERQNMVFEFDTEVLDIHNLTSSIGNKISEENAEKVKSALNQKLSDYNKLSETKFALLFEDSVISKNIPKKSMWSIAGGIIGFFVIASVGEVIFRRRR